MLSYVVGILEDLGEDEDGFDVEGFTEMLAAYIPEFSEIRPEQVCEWIFGLSAELAKRRKGELSHASGVPFSGHLLSASACPSFHVILVFLVFWCLKCTLVCVL